MIVLLNAMIPLPGETPGDWWGATGQPEARARADAAAGRGPDFDEAVHFLHDVPADVLAGAPPQRAQSGGPFSDGWSPTAWPDVPVGVVIGRDDRFFPAGFQIGLARERAGVEPVVVPGGHLLALADPDGLLRDGLGVPA